MSKDKTCTPSQVAATTRALEKYFRSVGANFAAIGESDAADWTGKADKLAIKLKPRAVT